MASIEIIAAISLGILSISLFALIMFLAPLLLQVSRTLGNLNETLEIVNKDIMPNLSFVGKLMGKASKASGQVGNSTKSILTAFGEGLKAGISKYTGKEKKVKNE